MTTSGFSQRQRGVALLVTLVLIALLALLAFSGSETTRLQQRLARNDQSGEIAFQAAEAALREALHEIESAPQLAGFCLNNIKRYTIDSTGKFYDDNNAAIEAALKQGVTVDFLLGDGQGVKLSIVPRYVISCINEETIEGYTATTSMVEGQNETAANDYHFFRIYAQGFGPAGDISRIIEARYVF
ncbi:pilus assembly PilX family protein [Halomonas sp. WWR20]